MIQCDREIKARKPDFVVVNKNERSCGIIDTAIPADIRVSEKEKQKIERYQELQSEIKRMWNIRSIKIIPVIVRTLGCTLKKLKNCIEELGINTITTKYNRTRDSYVKGFRLQIRFGETALDRGKKMGKGQAERKSSKN